MHGRIGIPLALNRIWPIVRLTTVEALLHIREMFRRQLTAILRLEFLHILVKVAHICTKLLRRDLLGCVNAIKVRIG